MYLLRLACLLVVGVGVLVATVILLDGEQIVHSMFMLLVGAEINAQLWLRHPA